ncbi:MAG: hypothetical protein AB2693_15930, partial [Candidatus Thiodiazotropha sp.]
QEEQPAFVTEDEDPLQPGTEADVADEASGAQIDIQEEQPAFVTEDNDPLQPGTEADVADEASGAQTDSQGEQPAFVTEVEDPLQPGTEADVSDKASGAQIDKSKLRLIPDLTSPSKAATTEDSSVSGSVAPAPVHRGLSLRPARSPVCDVNLEEQHSPVTFRRTPAGRYPGSFLSAEVEQMLHRRQELALGTHRDGAGVESEFDDEADLTPASDLGNADYQPPKSGEVEVLSGEEDEDMAVESEGTESDTVSTARQGTSFRGRVARKRKVGDDILPHVSYLIVAFVGRMYVGTYGVVLTNSPRRDYCCDS